MIIARYRPVQRVIAMTPNEKVAQPAPFVVRL